MSATAPRDIIAPLIDERARILTSAVERLDKTPRNFIVLADSADTKKLLSDLQMKRAGALLNYGMGQRLKEIDARIRGKEPPFQGRPVITINYDKFDQASKITELMKLTSKDKQAAYISRDFLARLAKEAERESYSWGSKRPDLSRTDITPRVRQVEVNQIHNIGETVDMLQEVRVIMGDLTKAKKISGITVVLEGLSQLEPPSIQAGIFDVIGNIYLPNVNFLVMADQMPETQCEPYPDSFSRGKGYTGLSVRHGEILVMDVKADLQTVTPTSPVTPV